MTPTKRTKKKKAQSPHTNGVSKKASALPTLEPNTPVPARSLAHLCGVDLKTVHQWAVTGLIPHFRTPGRHLRFRPEDVTEFLKRSGHPGAAAASGTPVVLVLAVKRQRRRYATQLKGFDAHFADNVYEGLVQASRVRPATVLIDDEQLSGVDTAAYLRALADASNQARVVVRQEGKGRKLRGAVSASSIEEAVGLADTPGTTH